MEIIKTTEELNDLHGPNKRLNHCAKIVTGIPSEFKIHLAFLCERHGGRLNVNMETLMRYLKNREHRSFMSKEVYRVLRKYGRHHWRWLAGDNYIPDGNKPGWFTFESIILAKEVKDIRKYNGRTYWIQPRRWRQYCNLKKVG